MVGALREAGAFAIEVYSVVKVDAWQEYKSRQINFLLVYADRDQKSHCRWMVPGTFEQTADT